MEDNRIVELYLARDEAAISQTSDKFGARLYSLAYGIVDDRQTAEECENDTYMQAWNLIPPPRTGGLSVCFSGSNYPPSVFKLLQKTPDRLKRSAFICSFSAEMEQCIPAPDDMECRIDDMALKDAIDGFLGSLDEERRNIFLRRYWYLDSIASISRRFSLSESKVKTTLFRCRRRFREYLEKGGYTI